MATIINKKEIELPKYFESVIFETSNFKVVSGALSTWSKAATPEICIKSKSNGKLIRLFGSQDMTKNDIENTKKRAIDTCKEMERQIFGG